MTLQPRDLAVAALSPSFNMGELAKQADRNALAEAIEQYEGSMVPMRKLPAEDRAKAAERIRGALRPIGAKLDPTMSPDQADGWRAAIVESLSKWPYRVALAAVNDGLSEPYRYGLRDVDATLHRLAAEHDEKHRLAIWRLQKIAEQLDRALNAQPKIEHQPKIWTPEDVEESNRLFRKLGIVTRYRYVEGAEPEAYEEAVERGTE